MTVRVIKSSSFPFLNEFISADASRQRQGVCVKSKNQSRSDSANRLTGTDSGIDGLLGYN